MMTPIFCIKKMAKFDLKMTKLEQKLDEIVNKFREPLENKHSKDNFDKKSCNHIIGSKKY